MSFSSPITKRRLASLAAAGALALGGLASSAVVGAGSAQAGTCTAGGAACSIAGSADLSPGTLSATLPSTLTWAAQLTGVSQSVVDTTAADQGYTVNDATGSGAGWHVTISATTFAATGGATLADSGTFSTNGSVTSATATTAPSQACTGGTGDCTLPDNTATTYPVAITTAAATPPTETIYQAAATTGVGSVDIGGSTATDPVGWWITVPGTTTPGTYTSTISVNIVSAP
ncbi:MAG TPA: WxL domain-containing protein [Trebonia sp.]|nr:WxL domain-containing protein [Trebonia sp.]